MWEWFLPFAGGDLPRACPTMEVSCSHRAGAKTKGLHAAPLTISSFDSRPWLEGERASTLGAKNVLVQPRGKDRWPGGDVG